MSDEELYVCAGICRIDAESGCCIGCGRPTYPAPVAPSVSEPVVIAPPIVVDWRRDSIEPVVLRGPLPNLD